MCFRYLITSTGYYKPFVFGACDKRNCVNLTITNDELLEETEIFEVTLERTLNLDSRIILEPVTTEINIIDDDGIMLVHRKYCLVSLFSPQFSVTDALLGLTVRGLGFQWPLQESAVLTLMMACPTPEMEFVSPYNA